MKVDSPAASSNLLNTQLHAAEPHHQPELDGIRGIALLAVMFSHAGPYIQSDTLTGKLLNYAMVPGWSGVELFFVLSGFLITGILLKTKAAGNYFSSFYMRRFLRIFPIYYFVVTLGLLLAPHSSWWNSLLPPLEKTRIAYYFYLQNWPVFWNHANFMPVSVFGHFWSLAVEEQFYIVWPLVIWLLPETGILWLCGAGLVLALPLRIYMVHLYAGDFTAMALTSSRVDGLLVGAMLAIFLRRGLIPLRWIYLALAVGASLLGYIAAFHHRELIATYVYMPTIGITGFALVMGAFLALSQHRIPWLHRVLTLGWLRTTGKYSYGMYIYHVPIYLVSVKILARYFGISVPMPLHFAWLYIAVLIGVTFLVAKLSYDYIESRILGLKIYFKPRFESRQTPARERLVLTELYASSTSKQDATDKSPTD